MSVHCSMKMLDFYLSCFAGIDPNLIFNLICTGTKFPIFRYRMHQKNEKGTKAWYRCTRYEANRCRATAVLHIASNTLLKVTRSHTHSPGFLQEFAR